MAGMESEQGTARVSPTGSSAELTGRRPARPAGGGADRRGELDLLRGLVVLGLVFFHSAVIFGAGELPIKRAPENVVAVLFVAFGATWGMPLLFVVAGMGLFTTSPSAGPRSPAGCSGYDPTTAQHPACPPLPMTRRCTPQKTAPGEPPAARSPARSAASVGCF